MQSASVTGHYNCFGNKAQAALRCGGFMGCLTQAANFSGGGVSVEMAFGGSLADCSFSRECQFSSSSFFLLNGSAGLLDGEANVRASGSVVLSAAKALAVALFC
jgi:hypothetical protein